MNELVTAIEGLSREEALEAAQYVGLSISRGHTAIGEAALLKPIVDKPYENIQEIEQLSRLVLLAAAAEPENEQIVRSAIEGVGRKQNILGGPEIVALAAIALLALNLVLTKGKSSESRKIRIEKKDGKSTFFVENKVSYGISSSLGELLKSYFGK